MTFSPYGNILATGSKAGTVRIRDTTIAADQEEAPSGPARL